VQLLLLNIDNKIHPLPIRSYTYTSKLHCYCTFAKLQQTTFNFSTILRHLCIIHWQS